jgi:hypothetical protein
MSMTWMMNLRRTCRLADRALLLQMISTEQVPRQGVRPSLQRIAWRKQWKTGSQVGFLKS